MPSAPRSPPHVVFLTHFPVTRDHTLHPPRASQVMTCCPLIGPYPHGVTHKRTRRGGGDESSGGVVSHAPRLRGSIRARRDDDRVPAREAQRGDALGVALQIRVTIQIQIQIQILRTGGIRTAAAAAAAADVEHADAAVRERAREDVAAIGEPHVQRDAIRRGSTRLFIIRRRRIFLRLFLRHIFLRREGSVVHVEDLPRRRIPQDDAPRERRRGDEPGPSRSSRGRRAARHGDDGVRRDVPRARSDARRRFKGGGGGLGRALRGRNRRSRRSRRLASRARLIIAPRRLPRAPVVPTRAVPAAAAAAAARDLDFLERAIERDAQRVERGRAAALVRVRAPRERAERRASDGRVRGRAVHAEDRERIGRRRRRHRGGGGGGGRAIGVGGGGVAARRHRRRRSRGSTRLRAMGDVGRRSVFSSRNV
eukprot:31426-Pelagococcus_subviridis.AAC.9